MTPPQTTRPLLAVSLKMYLSAARTRGWLREVVTGVGSQNSVDIAVLPTFPLLESTSNTCAGSAVKWGAQDLAPSLDGAQTGEVSATVLAELGCTYVEVGHAERRRIFGENDAVVVRKLIQATQGGLVPILCVGECEQGSSVGAARTVRAELQRLLDAAHAQGMPDTELVVAYEPIWAIGAPEPAAARHVRAVVGALRETVEASRTRIIYGGAAGVRTLDELWPEVDGLFLGRFAHDPAAVAALVARATDLARQAPGA